ncbi:MAG: tRNA lysidine(34) synthetase TilS [Chloroflexi bacterium]|nr:tRNA lysidine(34) synthetase TilS [Chloroflexota bacterium]
MTKHEQANQPHPIVAPVLLRKIREAQQRYQLFPAPTAAAITVIVGVSGGADSTCLLHALAQVAEPWRLSLHVAHVDHNLRPESGADAAFVAALAADLQLPFHGIQLPANSLVHQPGGLEAAARRARYAFLTQVAINVTPAAQVPLLVLAHHADDQAETLLLHLVRGSGLQGLGGMRWINQWAVQDFCEQPKHDAEGPATPIIQVVRPLLNVQRSEILDYLHTHNLPWREDSSNQETHLLRNQLRHEILPLLTQVNPNLVATMGRTAQILAAEAERLEQLDRAMLTEIAEVLPTRRVVIDLPKFSRLDLASQRGVLRQALAALQSQLLDVEFEPLERLVLALRANWQAGGPYSLLHRIAWSIAGATQDQPARLSLHQATVLPFLPDRPYLDEAWRQQIGRAPLSLPETLAGPDGWSLTMEEITMQALLVALPGRDEPWQAYLDADQVHMPLLTTPQLGLRFAPLGMRGHHQLLGDFFTNHKVPSSLRSGWPLILDQSSGEVLWVCGLQLGHSARITPQTRRVLSLGWSRL